nr:MAG TPA: hypothetical protein [Caudoviricetes sp.]
MQVKNLLTSHPLPYLLLSPILSLQAIAVAE